MPLDWMLKTTAVLLYRQTPSIFIDATSSWPVVGSTYDTVIAPTPSSSSQSSTGAVMSGICVSAIAVCTTLPLRLESIDPLEPPVSVSLYASITAVVRPTLPASSTAQARTTTARPAFRLLARRMRAAARRSSARCERSAMLCMWTNSSLDIAPEPSVSSRSNSDSGVYAWASSSIGCSLRCDARS